MEQEECSFVKWSFTLGNRIDSSPPLPCGKVFPQKNGESNRNAITAPTLGGTKRSMSMKQDASSMSSFYEEEPCATLQSTPTETPSPATLNEEEAGEALSVLTLAAECLRERENYRRGEPGTEENGLALLRRAIGQDDQEAW